ncbi:MAG: VCBS repeat-containing protein [Deltaproteobacteria bacterium]|nr:VCBS repeat-containing protein [Deltaproteobacteria bacterium]
MRPARFVASFIVALLLAHASLASAAEFFDEVQGSPLGSNADWTNYLRLDDLDGDGDLDVVVPNCGGFFANPQAQPFRVHRNDGKGKLVESPDMLGGSFSAPIRVVDLGDIDGDGDLDLFAPSAAGTPDRLFINDGKGSFTDEAASRIGTSSRSAGVRFLDVDGDGDLDLVVGAGYAKAEPVPARLYLNDGKGSFAEAPGKLPAVGPNDVDDVDAFDADRDGDLDLLLMSHGGKPALWFNDGAGNFNDASSNLGTDAPGLKYGPTACDVDGDGDLDLWLDNAGPNYTEALLVNDGSGHFVEETASRVVGNPGADDNGVVCADVDLDGDFDAIVASLSDVERVLLNDGTGHFTNAAGFTAIGDSTLWLDVGDLDGDGRLDAVTGQGESGDFRNRVYLGGVDNPADARPPEVVLPTLPGMLGSGQSVAVRFQVSDRVLVDAGPRVRAELRVSIDGAAPAVIPARFVGGDLFQATLVGVPGVSIVVEACAVDARANEGCSMKQTLQGPGTAAATSSASSASGGAGGGSAGAGGGAGGEGGATASEPADGGCGCRIAGPSRERPSGAGRFFVAALALALARRRRSG